VDSARREALATEILSMSAADETEVSIFSSDSALTRFTHETSNQNLVTQATQITVRAIAGQRTGVASSNSLDSRDLRALADRALAMARLAPNDPTLPSLSCGTPASAPARSFVEGTARASAEKRGAICEAIFRSVEAAGCWCAGYVSTGSFGCTVANTAGARSSFDGSDASVNAKVVATDSSGWAETHSSDVDAIDGDAVGRRAVRKARQNAAPRAAEPGLWTVILEPAAFGELIAFLGGHFSAQSYEEGSSFCSDGLDRKYFGDNVTILDDYAHPLRPSMPFDFEGYPTAKLPLVENGVVRNVVTDSYYAHKLGRANTGHALPAPNAYGPQARNVVVAPGGTSYDRLIAETERGILVTRFWYIRVVDQKQAIVTGMTRDGTFLIEKGRIAYGLRNMRFNQSIIEALQSCEFSSEQLRTANYGFDLVVPAVRIEGFNFTSATDF
jgi:PmbA protein